MMDLFGGLKLSDWWRSPYRRPLWQIPLAALGLLLYWPASKYVDWMDGK